MITEARLVNVRALADIATRRGQSLAQLALAWALRDPRMTSVVIGASSVSQLNDNLGALDHLSLTAEELDASTPMPSTRASTSGPGPPPGDGRPLASQRDLYPYNPRWMTGPRTTLDDVAARAGVSRMTVSNVYGRPDVVATPTRERVLAAAAELDYGGPSAVGRTLRRGSTEVLGILVNVGIPYTFSDPGAALFMRGVAQGADEADLSLQVVHTSGPSARRRVNNTAVDAFIAWSLPADDPALLAAVERRLPIVAVGTASGVPDHPVCLRRQLRRRSSRREAPRGPRDPSVRASSAARSWATSSLNESPAGARRSAQPASIGRPSSTLAHAGNSRTAGRAAAESFLERPRTGCTMGDPRCDRRPRSRSDARAAHGRRRCPERSGCRRLRRHRGVRDEHARAHDSAPRPLRRRAGVRVAGRRSDAGAHSSSPDLAHRARKHVSMQNLGLVAGVLTTAAWLPQIARTWRSRSADDLSWPYLLVFSSGVALWLVYGVLSGDVPVLAANAVTIVLVGLLLGLKMPHGHPGATRQRLTRRTTHDRRAQRAQELARTTGHRWRASRAGSVGRGERNW